MRVDVRMRKGGVGKTTTSINPAGAFADRGHDALAGSRLNGLRE